MSTLFVSYTNVVSSTNPTLILCDGHQSSISYSLSNAIIIVLPSRTSNVFKPLDVRIVGTFKAVFNKECQTYMKTRQTFLNITISSCQANC